MSRKLLAMGQKKLHSEFPLNQYLEMKSKQKLKTSLLQVPTDFKRFAQLCRIRSGAEIVPFDLYDWQQELASVLDRHNAVVFKTRQLGLTELTACKMLHKACLSSAYAGAVLSLGGKETSKVAKRVRRMPSVIPNFKFATNAVTELQVQQGGTITFAPSTDNAVRSLESTHDLLFDEAAFVPNEEEIYAGAVPSQEMVGADARTWVISTMSQAGALSWFWSEMFNKDNGAIDVNRAIARAQEGKEPFQYWIDENGWAKVIVHWKAHPIYALIPNYLLKVKTEKKIPDDKLQREYNLGLPQGRGALFGSDEQIQRNAVGCWREPAPDRYYLAGLDPNFGGKNRFNLVIWDISEKPYSLVYQYRSNQGTISYHGLNAIAAIKRYQPVITVIEKNSGGAVIREQLIQECPDLAIESVWMSGSSKPVHTDRIAFFSESGDVIYPPDWEGCSSWKDDDGTVYSSEMSQFSATTREAISGTDDAVMSWAIAFTYLADAVGEVQRLERQRIAIEAISGSVNPPQSINLWG